ncbi:MAG: hypothetical protein E7537_00795 [Ruminococcaceae bacterium]|nr:hypothetical protein [Oscillospiraceae bacterium]
MKSRIKKLLGIILSVVIVISVCVCAFITSATSKEITYYVKASGSDSATGLTVSQPLATVSQAIKNALDSGFAAGDTVYVNLVDYASINWGTSRQYNFKLVVRSNSENLRNTVVVSSGFTFGGDTAFESVIVKNITDIYYGNKNISFDNDCTFVSANHYLGNSVAGAEDTVANAQTVYAGNTVVSKNFRLSNKNVADKVYKEDVTAVFNNESSAPSIYFTATSGNTVFEKNLNVNVMKAKSVDFYKTGGTVNINGYLQVILNNKTKISDDSQSVLDSLSPSKGFYYIINASGVDDLINTTATAGKYAVNTERYKVIATNDEGVEHVAKDGYLTLPKAGRYVVRTVKIIETATYYVGPSGSDENDGSTSAKALATVAKAVELANAAGYLEGDLITIKVLRKSLLDSTAVTMGDMPRHYFDIVIENGSTYQPTINFESGAALANNQGGTTYYKNIKLAVAGTWKAGVFHSSNVVFDSNCTISGSYLTLSFGTSNDGGTSKTIEGQSVELNCNIPHALCLANGSWSGRTYTEDVNVIFNNSSLNPDVLFNSYWSGSKSGNTKYKKNVNLNLKKMKGVRFLNFDGAIFEGAIQVINSAGIDFDKQYTTSTSTAPKTINQALANVTSKYLINNNTGNADIIAFTETAGKFAVDTGKYKLTATGSKTYHSENGYLVLEEPGVYTLTLNHTHSYTDDCDEVCNSCGDVRTNAHVYTNVCDATCDVCGKVRTNNHVYDHGCDKTCNVCFMTRSTAHVYKGACDADCDVCLEERIASEHIFTNSCDEFCNVCNIERVITHSYSNDCDAICNICSYERVPHDHVYYNSCDASCNVCGAQREVEHVFDSACDKYCNKCLVSRKTSHVYSNSCDETCNICGHKRVVTHAYDNVCDGTCNICSEQRKAHVYDNNCDKYCNVCNNERTVTEHIFDSVCDTTCAECGTVRQTTHSYYSQYIANQDSHWKQCQLCGYKHQTENHTFQDACDKKCDVCGYIRATDGHQFDTECDTTCNTCDYVRAIVHTYSGVCDESCDSCGYVREGVGHRGGTATCKAKAVCEVCGEEYGEKNDNHIGEIKYRSKIAVKCNTDGYTGDGYCIACNKLAVPGSVIPATGLHKYSTECDTSCNTCGEIREITHQFAPATCTTAKKCLICNTTSGTPLGHSYTLKYEKATDQNSGRQWEECSGCGLVKNEKTLIQIATVELKNESYIYDGNVKLPEVVVKGINGAVITNDRYDVTCEPAIEVGTYLVIVKFKNGYSGKYTLSFKIVT